MVFLLMLSTSCHRVIQETHNENHSVIGLITEVKDVSLRDINFFELTDFNGSEFIFHMPQIKRGFTPSHLMQHMVSGDPVIITYVKNNDMWEVINIEDYK
jgi:hypothetical protein